MKKSLKILALLTSSLLLISCGGGGGGGGSSSTTPATVTPPTLNLNSAWNAFGLTNSTTNFTITGVLNGLTLGGSGTLMLSNTSPVSVQVFDPSNPFFNKNTVSNLTKVSNVESGTLIASGTSTVISSATDYYVNNVGAYVAINNVDETEQTLITSFTSLPTSVTAGSGGNFYTGTVYSRLGYTCGTETASFTVASDTNTSLLVTVTTSKNTTRQASGQCTTEKITSQTVYKLTAEKLSLVRATGSSDQFTGSVIQTY